MILIRLPEPEAQRLDELFRGTEDRKLRDRFQIVLTDHRGHRRHDIAAGLGTHPRSVTRRLNAYGVGPAGSSPLHRRFLVGTPLAVRDGIEAGAEEHGAETVLVVNIVYDHAARRRCYELIAEAIGLPQLSRTASGAGCRTS